MPPEFVETKIMHCSFSIKVRISSKVKNESNIASNIVGSWWMKRWMKIFFVYASHPTFYPTFQHLL